MKLTPDQSQELLARFCCYVMEACDKCSKLLGPVRYTRKDEPGEWCSRECRGDADREVVRRGGRPRKYRNAEMARAAKTVRQRGYRLSPSVEKTPSQLCGNKGLAGAKIGSLVV
jgi:hypothetical protein